MFKNYLDEKIADINKKLPTIEVRKKIDFHKKEQKEDLTASNTSKVEDKRWGGSWVVSANLESRLVFRLMTTTQLPDLVAWKMERKDKRWGRLAIETMKQSTSMNLKGNLPR